METERPAVEVDMDECCLSCTVKHDLLRALLALSESKSPFLVVLPIGLEATLIADYLRDASALGECGGREIRVAAIADVVGLDEFEERFFDDCGLRLCGVGEDGGVFDERSTGVVVSRLIREATHVLELPVIGQGCLSRHVDATRECDCRAIVAAVADCDAVVYVDAHEVTLRELLDARSSVGVGR